MTDFYTSVVPYGEKILLRGYRDGKPIKEKREFFPTLYVPSKQSHTGFRSLEGEWVEPFKPGTMSDCRSFINKYKSVSGFEIYGNTDYVYQFIADTYKGDIDYDMSLMKVASIDIETTCENGFPDPDDPVEQLIAITVKCKGKSYVFGLGEFHIDKPDVYCFKFTTEEDLVESFMIFWEKLEPDVITGWNTRFFDIPYLVNRIISIFGDTFAKRLSPWKNIKIKEVTKRGRTHRVYDLVGIVSYDYYELYTTFTYVNQESYKLDHIAYVELGERKVSHDEFDKMSDFYKNAFQKFMEYNLKDVELVDRLEDKLKLIELAVALAYSAKVNLMDVYSQVRTWDCIIYHYLFDHGVVIPQKKVYEKDTQYAGAFVKEPITGMHDWIVSLDLNSLYPHLIMQYNISPETKVEVGDRFGIGVDNLLKSSPEMYSKPCHEKIKQFISEGYSVAANGTCYRRDVRGFLPTLMEKMYQERSMYKKKMIEAQKELEDLPSKDMTTLGRAGYMEKLKKDISKYHNFQLVRKIQLNSAYGAIGNQYFRYYDVDKAEAITMSGQLSIRWIADKLNEFLNDRIGTEDYDFVVASDTDSVYLRLGKLVDKLCADKSKDEIVDFLDKACTKIIEPFIDKSFEELASMMNAYENKMVMGREVIADKGIWTAKKRYMLNVHDSEGVRYETPKVKIMGIETTRSSTPEIVRNELKEVIRLILTTDEATIINQVEKVRSKFFNSTPEEIAFPRSVRGLRKYSDRECIYKKSTPIAVKGALIYNNYLREFDLTKKYPLITEGDKIKFLYLKKPNPLGGQMGTDQVVSFVNNLPTEFGLDGFIDYEKQFEKSFLDPLTNILNMIGWSHEKRTTLEGLFV